MTKAPPRGSRVECSTSLDGRAERGRVAPSRPTRDPHRLSKASSRPQPPTPVDGTRTWRGTPVLKTTTTKRLAFVVAATTMVGALAACSSNDDDSSSSDTASAGTALNNINVWDPYPQNDETLGLGEVPADLRAGGHDDHPDVGRHGRPAEQPHVRGQGGQRARRDHARQPGRARRGVAGLLAPAEGRRDRHVRVRRQPRRSRHGRRRDATASRSARTPWACTTTRRSSTQAGVDPASITNWATLNDALAKVTAAGELRASRSPASPARRACSSSCPWFWGAGADLKDLASDQAIAAGQLVSDWIGKGYAPKSALTDNQSASWDLFLTGKYAFAENGSWFAKAASELTDFTAVAMPLPGKKSGAAPAPTGGEFVLAPLQKNDAAAHYANASKVIDCLVGKDNQVKTADALGYFAANKDLRAAQIASDPIWAPWAAVDRERTGSHDGPRRGLHGGLGQPVDRSDGRAQRRRRRRRRSSRLRRRQRRADAG